MRRPSRSFGRAAVAAAILLAAPIFTGAQTNVVPSRITQAIDAAHLTILQGNVNPLAQARFDRGAAPASLPMLRMLLVLKRSAQQEDALETLLQQQQNAASPNYHQWLTPQQFGQEFGPSDQDIQTITSWLQSQGFQVDRVSNGRTVIEFSGTAGEVQSAFHTSIHQYLVNGENHWANSSDPEIPTALTPVVAGIDTLYNFPRTPLYHLAINPRGPVGIGGMKPGSPEYTFPNPCSATSNPFCNFALGPYDFATIYNVLPLWNESPAIDGTGETIAIMGESDINISDIESFQKFFGMPVKDPNIIMDGPDPGTVAGDETESDLDVEWAGAIAKGANIDLVISESTEASLGVDLSAQYAVDNNLAPVLSESYGVCEFFLGTTGNTFYTQLWQQAAAQGITVVVSSGDAGSATCDGNLGSQGPAQLGLSVNGIASTPYNVAMGGTDFNQISEPLAYWNETNSTPAGSAGGMASLSAKGYIPEMAWNDTCTNQELFSELGVSTGQQACNTSTIVDYNAEFLDPAGGGGGKSGCTVSDGQNLSTCATPHTKPSWQTALTPTDGVRDVPDLAMFASNGFNGSFYIVCEADLLGTNNVISVGGGYASTSCDPNDQYTGVVGLGGTSAPTPAFAGIMALVNQATGSRQGNANYALYKMAGTSGNTCTSVANPASTCVFYDVPSGSTIAMPCASGTPNCTTSSGAQYGVLSNGSTQAYNTATGYDLATGLGSVDVANLIGKWKTFVNSLISSSTTLTLNSGNAINITHGQSVPLSIAVAAQSGGGTPTGNVSLIANTGPDGQQGVQAFSLTSGSASGSTSALPGGTYTVFASYPGDSTFASSTSSPAVSVTVAKEASKIQFAYELIDATTGIITNPNATSAVFGTPALLRVNVTSAAGDACANNAPGSTGCPTGSISLTDSYNGGAAAALDGGTFALNPQGYAEDQLVDLAGGTHVLAANYGGDNSYSAPSPGPTNETLLITPVGTSTDLTAPAGATTGRPANFSISIPAASPVYSSIGPTGTITLYSGGTVVATSPISGSVDPTSHFEFAVTSISTSALPHGQDSITAHYSGDGSYAPSTSSAAIVQVVYPSMVAVTTSNGSSQYGSPLTFTAQVTNSENGAPPMTGTVSFTTDSGNLGTATVSNGTAQITTSSVPGGAHAIAATYSGDGNYAPASGSVSESVSRNGSATSVTTSNGTVTQGQSVTITVTVTASPAGPLLPTGNVELSSNGSNFGSANISGGTGQFTTTSLPLGTDQITANYGGDENYLGSASGATTVTVNPAPTFTVTANPTTIPITAPGQPGSTVLMFTGENGFSSNGSVTINSTCNGLPAYSSCSVNPSNVNIATNGTAQTTLTVTTTAPSAVIPSSRKHWDIGGWNGSSSEKVAALSLLLLLCGGIAFGFQGRQRRWGLAFALVTLAFVFGNVGCGGGSSGSTGPTNPGTPVGSANVMVSITINGVTQTAPVTVNVQ